MATEPIQKRANAGNIDQDHRPSKKIKSIGVIHLPNFPPEFWDGLSKVPLTRRALRELDRRNRAQKPARAPARLSTYTTDVIQFARHGGPDLCHLRSYAESKGAVHAMEPSSSGTLPCSGKRISAYDKAFEEHLRRNHVFLDGKRSKPKNKPDLRKPRLSLSSSNFSEGAFQDFQDKHDWLGSEADVIRKIIPVIQGNSDIHGSGEVLFNNLVPITDCATVDPKPDFYDGARLEEMDAAVRDKLHRLIIPSTNNAHMRPAAPNLFLEVKAPEALGLVARRQAGHVGAMGARGMHALQNYGAAAADPAAAVPEVFDGNAYSFSSTYHSNTGTLDLYAHHVTAPTSSPQNLPEYHMTRLRSFAMIDSREAFVAGATAFRNLRDLAREHRDRFIEAANERARQTRAESPPEGKITAAAAGLRGGFVGFVGEEGSVPRAWAVRAFYDIGYVVRRLWRDLSNGRGLFWCIFCMALGVAFGVWRI